MNDPLGESPPQSSAPQRRGVQTARKRGSQWWYWALLILLLMAAIAFALMWTSGFHIRDHPPTREELALCATNLRDAYDDLERHFSEASSSGLDDWGELASEAERRQTLRELERFDDRLMDARRCYDDIASQEAITSIDATRLVIVDWSLIYEEIPLNASGQQQETDWYEFKVVLNLVGGIP